MSGAAWCLLLALGLGPVDQPLLRQGDDWLFLEAVPPILEGEEVRRQLDSGLTTSFVFQATARDRIGRKVTGGAQVEVRFEPWDEVYFVTTLSARDGRRQQRLDSFEALLAWWRRPDLALLEPAPLSSPSEGGSWRIEVEVRVIPFSAAEQEEARRWFAHSWSAPSLDSPGGAAEEVGRATDEQTQSLGRVLQVLMATSIQRRALERHHWTVEFDP